MTRAPSQRHRAAALLTSPDALLALLTNPIKWLKDHGLSPEDIACTEEAHAGLANAERVAAKANELAPLPLVEALPRLYELFQAVWGDDVQVDRIPFGVTVAQRPIVPRPLPPVPPIDDNPGATTGTGTVSCTFGLSCKPDVDR